MQDMATMQQQPITSPTPGATQDSSLESLGEMNCGKDVLQETSRTDTENCEVVTDNNKPSNDTNEDNLSSNSDNELNIDETSTSKESAKTEVVEEDETAKPNNVADEEVNKIYTCPICEVNLPSQHEFTLHIRSHNNDESCGSPMDNYSFCSRGFSCRVCGKVLSSSSSLDRHVLVHSGERPFKCRVCGVAFTTNGNMHRHMRTHGVRTDNYESDCSTDSGGGVKSPAVPVKKRKISTESNNNEINRSTPSPNSDIIGKRKASDSPRDLTESCRRRVKSSPNVKDLSSGDKYHCNICDRCDFQSLFSLENHFDNAHPEYKIKCQPCNLYFKSHRALNIHREAIHHNNNNSVFGFKDLTFVDFSSQKFPLIARTVCEKSVHKASSNYLRFQCETCDRAFPCNKSLTIHRQECSYYNKSGIDDPSSSDNEMPTDLSHKQLSSSVEDRFESEDELEGRRRDDFFAGLDLRNKSTPPSPTLSSDASSHKEDYSESALYYNPTYTGTGKCESSKDLADIQSIISVASAGGFMHELSKSPQPLTMTELTPPDSGAKDSHMAGEEEPQDDWFSVEFRKMKLKGEFPCRLCSAVFPNLRALKGHNRLHLTAATGPFKCNMCPYVHGDKAVLTRHMRTHNGDRPYECAVCNYAFTTKANCERHLRNRHSKLSREEVKESIIYHPSEDPTNDPDLQSKLSAREDVKRTLVFNRSSSLEDLNASCDHIKTYEDHTKRIIQESEEHLNNHKAILSKPVKVSSPSRINSTPNYKDISVLKHRPMWNTQESSSIISRKAEDDIESDVSSDDRANCEEMKVENGPLINFSKNNLYFKNLFQNPRFSSFNSLKPEATLQEEEDNNAPLDLSMDALDLSKKKKNLSADDTSTEFAEPQDLSKRSVASDYPSAKKLPIFIPQAKSENSQFSSRIINNSTLTPPSFSQISNHTTSPQLSAATNNLPKRDINMCFRLPPAYIGSNGFSFQSQPVLPLSPYIMQTSPLPIFPDTNLQDFTEMKERLQKELIRGLQFSGGSILNRLEISSLTGSNRFPTFQQHSYNDYVQSQESKPSFVESNPKADDTLNSLPLPVKEVSEKLIHNAAKISSQPLVKSSKESSDTSSVKLVIKNGVLMPKQKQRRYRTERPFACEHCSARFTLRSNMERHIKQQHPQFWNQRQRGGNVLPGRKVQIDSRGSTPSDGHYKPSSTPLPVSIVGNDKVQQLKLKQIETQQDVDDKSKDSFSVSANNNNNNKTLISDEVKLAIAQQLKSKLIVPQATSDSKVTDAHRDSKYDDDDDNELVIDEEKEDEATPPRQLHFRESTVKDENVVDLASVSRLLDNANTQTQTFQQFFRSPHDACDASEDEEGLVAGSNSEGNNSGSDENKSESEATSGKKKSAYSLAPNRVSCPYCNRKFPWSSSLRRHVLTHTGQKPFKCQYCPLLFTTKSNCDRHLLRKHGGVHGPSSATPGENIEPPGNNNANTSSYVMRNVPERPYKCNYCPSSTFSTQSNLRKHIATKHNNCGSNAINARSDELGNVSHCDSGSDETEDRTHVPLASNIPERTSAPEILPAPAVEDIVRKLDSVKPMSISSSGTNETHSSSELPFKCHLCEGSFAERQDALDHIRDHHSSEFDLLMSKGALDTAAGDDSGIHPQEDGNHCGDESMEQLRGKFPDYANRKVKCAFCLRRFWSAEDLRRHMRTHTGERPFSCDICRRRFTLKHSMLRHRRKHGNIRAPADEASQATSIEEEVPETPPSGITNINNNTIVPVKRTLGSSEEETDLIGNLLGIQDRSIIDKVLQSKSADDAAKLLGVKE